MRALDEIDRRMIDELRRDGRISVPALAERLGIARATAYARFDRLVDDGVVTGFRAEFDPAALGLDISALVLVDIDQSDWQDVQRAVVELPGVEWVGLATGPFDIVLRVRCEDLTRLRDVVLVRLHEIPQVRSAQTVVLLDEPAVSNHRPTTTGIN